MELDIEEVAQKQCRKIHLARLEFQRQNVPSVGFKAPPHPKAIHLWLISARCSEYRCSVKKKKKRFRVHVPPSVLCHHLSCAVIPTSLAHGWGREQPGEPPPHQWDEPSTLCLSEAAYSTSQRHVCARQAAWGLNGPTDNQGLNTLSAFWEIGSRRCHSVRGTRGDKSRRRTNCEGFMCINAGRLSRGAAVEQRLVVQLQKMNSWRGPGCF